MTSPYKAKPKSRRGRMLRAARLRADGLSLREIAVKLQVHHSTVAEDLKRWEAEQAKVSVLPVGKLPRTGGKNPTPESDSEAAAVLPLRRLA